MGNTGIVATKAETQKYVDYRFKILYALGMVLVVMGHGAYPTSLLTEWFPAYSFHLGLFAFCSGYFYKPKVEETNIYI